jgi:thiosulfate dehydrogenase [quinone] large subunit
MDEHRPVSQASAGSAASNAEIAYFFLRFTLGVNFFMHGLARILSGHAVFFAYIEKQMQYTELTPGFLNVFSYVLPYVELSVGLLLLLGLFTRVTLVVTSLLMLSLQAGVCLAQNWSLAGEQLIYVIILFILLTFESRNRWSVDRMAGLPSGA